MITNTSHELVSTPHLSLTSENAYKSLSGNSSHSEQILICLTIPRLHSCISTFLFSSSPSSFSTSIHSFIYPTNFRQNFCVAVETGFYQNLWKVTVFDAVDRTNTVQVWPANMAPLFIECESFGSPKYMQKGTVNAVHNSFLVSVQ